MKDFYFFCGFAIALIGGLIALGIAFMIGLLSIPGLVLVGIGLAIMLLTSGSTKKKGSKDEHSGH